MKGQNDTLRYNHKMDFLDLRYTLIFLTRGQDVLMLHRRKPPNQGLWNGIGGHIEAGEAPLACALREIREETGFVVEQLQFHGLLTWEGYETPAGGLYIFTAEAPAGELAGSDEGELAWIPREWVFSSPEVVSNIHIFGPAVFNGDPPRVYHFHYRAGEIEHFEFRSLPPDLNF